MIQTEGGNVNPEKDSYIYKMTKLFICRSTILLLGIILVITTSDNGKDTQSLDSHSEVWNFIALSIQLP